MGCTVDVVMPVILTASARLHLMIFTVLRTSSGGRGFLTNHTDLKVDVYMILYSWY